MTPREGMTPRDATGTQEHRKYVLVCAVNGIGPFHLGSVCLEQITKQMNEIFVLGLARDPLGVVLIGEQPKIFEIGENLVMFGGIEEGE